LFIAWQQAFDVSFAELGLAMAVMAASAVVMQTPIGFLVDRSGATPGPTRCSARGISCRISTSSALRHAPVSDRRDLADDPGD
jgi:hypothetical protein